MSEFKMDDIKTNTISEDPKPVETAPEAEQVVADEEVSSAAPVVNDAPVVGGTSSDTAVSEPKKSAPANLALYAVIAILLLSLAGLALKLNSLSQDKTTLENSLSTSKQQLAAVEANPQAVVQKQTDALIGTVGKLMNLPTGETPTVAAVSDVAAAKKQSAFFASAENGDKVLLYVKAGEAILYRPSTNKIVLVAPLTFNNATVPTPVKK